ncbi:zinc-binding dehydrogenase [Streptomyces sp. SID4919]|uniref:zinc-binding dehydrogenase n=1 Tax=unclassified Streptomyces TaxID=2593676 RepID=UPI00082386B2|nr:MULTISPECIES: zinc-binding dehydrogenase [unclassified Streptomyces]MYY12415.1 zinc-binding dehydrogenase [Streptomyces sp. SID4919]SCK54437.1 NADPH:quinone reductase [Streptomyces sp. AmelKG-E11A]
MKVVLHRTHGGPDVLQVADVPMPDPGVDEVLVRVEACGLNHLDVLQRRGPSLIPGFTLPHVSGMDIAGTIAAVGPAGDGRPGADPASNGHAGKGRTGGASPLAEGARVVVNPAVPCGNCADCVAGADGRCATAGVIGANLAGGYAEYVLVPTANVHQVPDEVDLVDAAVVPTIWMTAWHALVEIGKVRLGETVLIHAAGSGVSTALIQLAKAAGARVVTTVGSDAKTEYARALGADVVVNSTTEDVVAAVREVTGGRGADLVLDHVGPATWNTGVYSLAPRGRLVFFGNTTGNRAEFDLVYAYHFGLQLLGSDPYDRREFAAMLDAYWASTFRTPIDSEFPLVDAAAAQERMESRRATGKIVLRP